MSIENLKKKASVYSVSQEYLDSKEKGRLDFIAKFPLGSLLQLKLDEYVLGTDKESFCYWLEFKKIDDNFILFGIGGGNSSKFGLYKSKNGSYQKGYGKSKITLVGSELEDYFSSIKSSILTAIRYVSEDRVSEIKKMSIPFGNIILLKILSIYFPDKFITIGSSGVLLELAKDIDVENIELIKSNIIEINYECKKKLDSTAEFENWSYERLGTFVWNYLDGESKKGGRKESVKYYLLGAYWEGFEPEDQTARFVEALIWENGYEEKFIDEVNAVPVGSKVAVKSVFTREKKNSVMAIKAIGTVIGNQQDGKKLIVDWDEDFIPFEVDFSGGYWVTIKEVTNREHVNAIFNKSHDSEEGNFNALKDKFQPELFTNYLSLLRKLLSDLGIQRNDHRVVYSVRDNSLNFIVGQRYCFNLFYSNSKGIYGVISKVKIADNTEPYAGNPPQPFYSYFNEFNPNSSDWQSIKESVNEELSRTSKSGFIKYNDEDFENFVFSVEQNPKSFPVNFPLNTILYGPPGTGKTFNTIIRAAEIIENKKINSYQEALKIFNDNLHDRIEFITFHQNYSYEDFIQGLRPETDNKSSLTFDKKDGVFKRISDKALENIRLSERKPEELSREALFDRALERFKDLIEEHDTNYPINETAYILEAEADAFRYTGEKWNGHPNGLRMKYSDLMQFYRNDVKSRKDIKFLSNISGLAIQHATYYFLVFEEIMKFLPEEIESPIEFRKDNYVIVIDEINRANISRVFGELITLIEPDKRSHGDTPLEVKLPSGDHFVVPSNLYIIGTMNTADKSISLLDIALRRRFEFEPMYPLYKIEGSEIYDADILYKLNEQIIKLKGYDFQVGHAYFMGENNDLLQRMNKKVIPLLLEYFMNDFKEVKNILFNAGLQVEENSWPLRITGKRV
jgi:hypothetical protein